MLAFKPQKRYKPRTHRHNIHWPADEEEAMAFAQPSPPMPVVLAADEEAAIDHNTAMEDILESDHSSEKDLPAPPPIYGNWRGSVVCLVPFHFIHTPKPNQLILVLQRADPNLIHWQLHTNQPDVQREARELIFAGSGHRPPSYTSDEMVESPVRRPLPLFAERRRAAGVVDV